MHINRRTLLASTVALGAASAVRPAWSKGEPIRVGWLTQLTGASTSVGVAYNAGMKMAVDEINNAGGVDGRRIEVIMRDTASDPSKAISAATELATRERVHLIWGPSASGESLAAVGVLSRFGIPNLTPAQLDGIIDVEKYPNIFRAGPLFSDTLVAVSDYVVGQLKASKVAIIGDTTAVGVFAVDKLGELVASKGATVVYSSKVDSNQPDFVPDLTRAKQSGAEVIIPWSAFPAFMSRILNARAAVGFDVPVAGHPSIGSGEVRNLLEKPENWENAYSQYFRNCSFDASGNLPERTKKVVQGVQQYIDVSKTLLYWVANGYDGAYLIADAVKRAGSTEKEALIAALNQTDLAGAFGHWRFTKENHNGLRPDAIVMVKANSLKDGAFELAPGYS